MIRLQTINSLSELNRLQWKFIPSGPNEVKCLCPIHEDVNPSVSLNTEKNVWICHASSCEGRGDIVSLLAHIAKCERKTILADLITRYPDLEAVKVVNQERLEIYHKAIWKSGPFLTELYKRGVTDLDIRTARLGYHDGRIMIPVYDKQGRAINVRKYLPGAPGEEKMKNIRGYTTKALYQIDQLRFPVIWICGGEIKALVAKRMLTPHNTGAVSVTAGEGAWDVSFTPQFKDKHVFICMDIDAGGRAASKKIAQYIYGVTKTVKIINLPLDKEKYPKGDINDWVGLEGADSNDFYKQMQIAKDYTPPASMETESKEITRCKLKEAARAENIGMMIECKATISALDEVPFVVPKTIAVSCTKDQPYCNVCKVKDGKIDEDSGLTYVKVSPSNPGLLDLLTETKRGLKQALLNALNAPNCKVAELFPKKFYNVLDGRLTSPLELDGDNSEHIVQPTYMVTDRYVDLNIPYVMSGRPYPHPKSSQAVLLVNDISDVDDSLTSCKFTKEDIEALSIFRPSSWSLSALSNKLSDIYEDLSNNVTRIFQRSDLHLGIDLAYHSTLYFTLENRRQHGWVNCLITGDSSQGKSEASLRLIDHYGLGTRHDCKNASEAGLLGGLQQLGTRWFVTWGVIPIYDKQLVVLEEIKGASTFTLGSLTDMRSSGYAQITKIERRKAHARTRLIMISNPRSDRPISAYNYGVEAIRELMGSLEDVRRFDFALVLSEQEISSADINHAIRTCKIEDPLYSAELCRKNILWAWTRTADQVKFNPDAYDSCLKLSQELCSKYSETVPLCDKGTMRYKLGRLAVALAGRTFSTERDSTIVRKCHVEGVYEFLCRSYDNPYCGYKAFSDAEEYTSKLKDPQILRKNIKATKFPRDLVEQLLHSETIVLADICDWCSIPKDTGQKVLSLFVRKRALFRDRMQYVKSSGFINLLKEMLKEDGLDKPTTEGEEF